MEEESIWRKLRELDEDRSTFTDETAMLLLRHSVDYGKEYKLLEYNALDETFYNPMTEEYEDVNIYESAVEYINLDELQ